MSISHLASILVAVALAVALARLPRSANDDGGDGPSVLPLPAHVATIETAISPHKDWVVWIAPAQDDDTRARLADDVTWLRAVLHVYARDETPIRGAVVHYADAVERRALARFWPTDDAAPHALRLFVAQPPDRSCLLAPPRPVLAPPVALPPVPHPLELWDASEDESARWLAAVVARINEHTHRYRDVRGRLTPLGRVVANVSRGFFDVVAEAQSGRCEELHDVPDADTFVRDYALRSRPVILRGAASSWPAIERWSSAFLREHLGNQSVHIKLTPDGEFEGCEPLERWPGGGAHIPAAVRSQLAFGDIAVVRPAPAEMQFADFLDLLDTSTNVSAYLEYTSISSSLPLLLRDVRNVPVARDLEQEHLNIWLGNGRTVGKLHFDPFENLLCQVTGAKHLTIFAPHANENLYEGHLAEVQLSFDRATLSFARDTLLESTSMVMSPVDITRPDLARYPRFSRARALECEIRQGDVLYLPAFWWHEVRSRPDEHRRNIAVNFWFKPVLDKAFPCCECRLFVSPVYRDLVTRVHGLDAPSDGATRADRPLL